MDEEEAAAIHRPSQDHETTPLLRKEGAAATQDAGNGAIASSSHSAENEGEIADGGGVGSNDHVDEHQIKARRRRRWIALLLSGILIIAFVVILIVSGVLSGSNTKRPAGPREPKMNFTICTTDACANASSELLNYLSPNYRDIDPCTNFDTLVCGGFDNEHGIPPGRSSYSTPYLMKEKSHHILRDILESPYPANSNHSSFSPANLRGTNFMFDTDNYDKMIGAYISCMDEDALDEIGAAPLVDLINQLADAYPVLKDGSHTVTESDHTGISKALLFLQQKQITSFQHMYAAPNDKYPEAVIIQSHPSGLTLPSLESYTSNETMAKFEAMLSTVFGDLLPDEGSRANAADLAKSVVDLEKKIAAITPLIEDQQDVTQYFNIGNLEELRDLAPALGLDQVVKGLVPDHYAGEHMLLAFPNFVSNVSAIISNTTRSTLQSYMVWHTINSFSTVIKAPEIEPVLRFDNEMSLRDPTAQKDRFDQCLGFVDYSVGWILSRFYVEAAFSEKGKQFGDDVIRDIKDQYIARINELDWMEESVKEAALIKVDKVQQKIGYPAKSFDAKGHPTRTLDVMDAEALAQYYTELEIGTSYFNNSLASREWKVKEMWSTLGHAVDHERWQVTSEVVDAYFDLVNEIFFPAALLQFPVFSADLPSYVSYGSFGSIAGHELSHGFDMSGRHYDETGKYRDWWTNRTVDQFEEKADCFVRQYSNFSLIKDNAGRPLHVDGRLTAGENIADAGGVNVAFDAWKKRQDESMLPKDPERINHVIPPTDQDLPGLEFFTHDQLFFVSWASFWCGKTRRAAAEKLLHSDPHAPASARILGTMANSRAFRESYNCPVKEPTCELL